MRCRVVLLGVCVGLVVLSGCGGGPVIAPVKGRVMFQGKPVANAAVSFSPVAEGDKELNPGKPGTGFTDKDGYYVLSTYKAYDGAQVGQHRVRVALEDNNPIRSKRITTVVKEVKDEDNVVDIELEP